MSGLVIELVPVREKSANGATIGRYRALLDGEPIIRPTRQPFFNAARALIALGYDPDTIMVARHTGSAIDAMRSTIGEAAKWMIVERDRDGLSKVPWQPYAMAHSSPQEAPKTSVRTGEGTEMPPAQVDGSLPAPLPLGEAA